MDWNTMDLPKLHEYRLFDYIVNLKENINHRSCCWDPDKIRLWYQTIKFRVDNWRDAVITSEEFDDAVLLLCKATLQNTKVFVDTWCGKEDEKEIFSPLVKPINLWGYVKTKYCKHEWIHTSTTSVDGVRTVRSWCHKCDIGRVEHIPIDKESDETETLITYIVS